MKKEALVDLPCYSAPEIQDEFRNKIWKSCTKNKSSNKSTEVVKILAPLTYNPNAPNINGGTPIHMEVCNGHTEIIKILAPLTDNPNAPNKNGESPSSLTKNAGIRKILNTSRKRKAGPKSKPSMKQAKKF